MKDGHKKTQKGKLTDFICALCFFVAESFRLNVLLC